MYCKHVEGELRSVRAPRLLGLPGKHSSMCRSFECLFCLFVRISMWPHTYILLTFLLAVVFVSAGAARHVHHKARAGPTRQHQSERHDSQPLYPKASIHLPSLLACESGPCMSDSTIYLQVRYARSVRSAMGFGSSTIVPVVCGQPGGPSTCVCARSLWMC